MIKPGDAGYSAFRRGVRLWAEDTSAAALWAVSAGGGGALASSLALGGPSVASLAAGGAAGVGAGVWRLRRGGEWRRWLQGAQAERRTGRVLRELRQDGWKLLHDRRVPRSKANLDHIAVPPHGRFLIYLDTKAWHAANARIRVIGGSLMYGPWNQAQKVDTVRWEAERLAQVTGLRVYPFIVVDGGTVVGRVLETGAVRVVAQDQLVGVLREFGAGTHDWQRVVAVAREINREFVAAR
jgi:gamma-glutamylcyclotransferase (GGCT)/AIG2-like uncharacterized protein YtfP